MKSSVKLKQEYHNTPEELWVALTDVRALSEWLMETSGFSPEVGCRFQFRSKPTKHWRGIVDCEVLDVQPNRMLSYSWQGDNDGTVTVVTWRLEPIPTGTRLILTHTGFEGISGLLLGKLILGPGWKKMMKTKILMVLGAIDKYGK